METTNPLCCTFCKKVLIKHQTKFCSFTCQNKSRAVYPKTRNCEFCNSPFQYSSRETEKRFCDHSCAAKANNPKSTVWKACTFCQTLYTNHRSKGFCSVSCKDKHRLSQWLSGQLSGSTKYGYASYIKPYLMNEANHRCSQCGFSGSHPTTGNSILQVDHIDGDYLNNSRTNLRILCPNCHTMTENYGSLNTSGRSRRWKAKYRPFRE